MGCLRKPRWGSRGQHWTKARNKWFLKLMDGGGVPKWAGVTEAEHNTVVVIAGGHNNLLKQK